MEPLLNSKTDVKKTVEKLIIAGGTQQEVFDQLSKTILITSDDLAEIIEKTPALQHRKKWKVLNYLLMGYIMFILVFNVLSMGSYLIVGRFSSLVQFIFPILINILLLIGLMKYKKIVYNWIIFFNSCSLIYCFANDSHLAIITLLITAIVICIVLKKVLFQRYDKIKELFLNENGEKKLRYKYVFKS